MDLDRRGFLQSAGAGAFSGRLSTHKINVAFVGRGEAMRNNWKYAAQTPGIRVVAVDDFRRALADASIHAVYIGCSDQQADMTVAACAAGKDVWLENAGFTNLDDGLLVLEAARRNGRIVQTDAVHRSAAHVREVRDLVQRGDLGRVTFCRALGPAAVVDILQFVFNEAVPLSVSAQAGPTSRLATYQYPDFVASHETGSDTVAKQITFHGTGATLTLRCGAANPGCGPAFQRVQPAESRLQAGLPAPLHWANFAECIRTRRQPAADMEAYVRTARTLLMAANEVS